MNKLHLYIFGLLVSAAVVLSQNLPRTLPPLQRPGYGYQDFGLTHERVTRNSRIGSKEYVSILEQAEGSREWESSAPLPVSIPAAEKVARTELAKVVPDEADWIATDFQISRFGPGPNWYYAVTLKPIFRLRGERSDSFNVLVDFAGKAGQVQQLGPQ